MNGSPVAVCPGKYCVLEREWNDADRIGIQFHPEVKVIRPAGTQGVFALKYGALILAEPGSRNAVPDPEKKWEKIPAGYGHLVNFRQGDLDVCDYASAGRGFSENDPLRVFFKE